MQLPKITRKQQDILKLLYTYRFLNRIQIQQLMGHSDKRRIIAWLKDLREQQYVEWIYSTDFAEKTKPAVYYISINGVRWLKRTNDYPVPEVRKRYHENDRSAGFILHAILLAGISIDLQAKSGESVRYAWQTQADYATPGSTYHFLNNDGSIHPDLCFTKQEGDVAKTYLLELFDATLPRYRVRNRLKQYVEYLQLGDWERETASTDLPTVLFVCPTVSELIYAKRRVRALLDTLPLKQSVIKFATLADVQEESVTGEIWEDA